MTDLLKRRWLLCEEEPGCVLVDLNDLGKPDLLQVDVNSCLINEEVEAVALHIVNLHNASLSPQADPWIELATLGGVKPDAWPWNGDPVLIHCRSIIPMEPGVTGQGRFACRPGHGWDWWLVGTDTLRDPPVRGICGPVTHVRRLVPPVEG